jgi:hypothetical protein
MTLYFLHYGIARPGDYSGLETALAAVNAKQLLPTLWCFRRDDTNCDVIRDLFADHFQADDRFFVSEVTKWSVCGLSGFSPFDV